MSVMPKLADLLPTDHLGRMVPRCVVTDPAGIPVERYGWAGHCHKAGKCFVCGRKLAGAIAFVARPLAYLLGTADEPPAHPECALYPLLKAAPTNLLVYVRDTKYKFSVAEPRGAQRLPLYEWTNAATITLYAKGRVATKAEIVTALWDAKRALDLALPSDPKAIGVLERAYEAAIKRLPAAIRSDLQ
jgi:hypothetical protein